VLQEAASGERLGGRLDLREQNGGVRAGEEAVPAVVVPACAVGALAVGGHAGVGLDVVVLQELGVDTALDDMVAAALEEHGQDAAGLVAIEVLLLQEAGATRVERLNRAHVQRRVHRIGLTRSSGEALSELRLRDVVEAGGILAPNEERRAREARGRTGIA